MSCSHDRKDPPARRGRNAARLADLQADDTDKILLTVARHFFCALARPGQDGRRLAASIAELSFGPGRGTAMAAALYRAIEAMRMARSDAFFYNDPNCPGCSRQLTEAELYLFQALRSVRLGRTSAASAHAMLLCEGNDYAPFLEAAAQVFRAASDAQWQHDTGSWQVD